MDFPFQRKTSHQNNLFLFPCCCKLKRMQRGNCLKSSPEAGETRQMKEVYGCLDKAGLLPQACQCLVFLSRRGSKIDRRSLIKPLGRLLPGTYVEAQWRTELRSPDQEKSTVSARPCFIVYSTGHFHRRGCEDITRQQNEAQFRQDKKKVRPKKYELMK